MPKLYGFTGSGNCSKAAWVLRYLSIDFDWVEVDIFAGESRRDGFLQLNPAGQVPVLELDDGRLLTQSDAILLYLARDSDLVPGDPWRLAQVYRWLFWEQNSHEPSVAVCRADVQYRGKTVAQLDPALVAKGHAALDLMERHLEGREWFVDGGMTVADVALVAYTRDAPDGGFDLGSRPAVRAWIGRVEAALGIEPRRS